MDMDQANESVRRWVSELTGKTGDALDALLRDGAAEGDYVEATEIISNASAAASSRSTLTPAELLALNLVADGMMVQEIADHLNVSYHTVHRQLKVGRRRSRC